MNPILPREHLVPDAEARVMPDGRLYLYGSYDMAGCNTYCSDVLHVFSTDDMVHWTDHGVCFESSQVPWAEPGTELYAPDCIYRDGKYYLYFCMRGCVEGVATADTPWGPFQNPVPVKPADGDSIDPAVFLDDDGQAYYYWGQFQLRGAKMNPDMCTLDVSSINRCIIDEKRHNFHEGSSMRKRNGIYYLVFADISRGRPTSLGYAMSKSPLGPFEYQGIIVDNIGCDPKTWNNHGSIAEYKGQWYVFYHRTSRNSECQRRMCVEPIYFDEEGKIHEVLPTTQGAETPIPALRGLQAADACRLGGWGSQAYLTGDPENKTEEILTGMEGYGWALYRYVDFSEGISNVSLLVQADGKGQIEVWADNELLGQVTVEDTGSSWKKFAGELKNIQGVHTLYLEWRLDAGCHGNLKEIAFA